MSNANNTPEPLPEWMLDKMTGVLEGPVNSALERVMKSRLVLAPLSLSMTIGLRLYRKAGFGKQHKAPAARSGRNR